MEQRFRNVLSIVVLGFSLCAAPFILMTDNFRNVNRERYREAKVKRKSDRSIVHAELGDKMKYSKCCTPTFYRDLYTNESPALQIEKVE